MKSKDQPLRNDNADSLSGFSRLENSSLRSDFWTAFLIGVFLGALSLALWLFGILFAIAANFLWLFNCWDCSRSEKAVVKHYAFVAGLDCFYASILTVRGAMFELSTADRLTNWLVATLTAVGVFFLFTARISKAGRRKSTGKRWPKGDATH